MWLSLVLSGCREEPEPTTPEEPEAVWTAAEGVDAPGSLSGVWASGPDDVWVVGGDEQGCEIWHGSEGAFSLWPEPPPVDLLVWVHGFAPDDIFAVGVGGGAVHFDGTSWSVLETGTTTDLWGVFGESNDDLWVVGGDPEEGEPLILHYDGTSFDVVPLDPAENDRLAHALFKVFGVDGRLFAVGQAGLVVEWDGTKFVQVGTGASDDFVSLWGSSADDLVAVGGRAAAQVATFDGVDFQTTSPPGVPGLNAVTLAGEEVVVAGVSGWVGHLDRASGELVRETAIQSLDLHAAFYDGAGRVYAVGGRFYEPHTGAVVIRTTGTP